MSNPRIGVYVCHCGTNIAGKVNVPEVVEHAKKQPFVVVAKEYKFMCSDPGQAMIVEDIKKEKLDRVIVAACSPLMHENTFRKACQKAGINKYLFQMANIREHCSWVHEDGKAATEKAKALVMGAIYRSQYNEELFDREAPMNPATLIVGGGIAGIQAAIDIAESGRKVYLVEKEPSIGGYMAQFDKTFPTLDCAACILTPKMVSVGQHPNITLLSYSEVEKIDGYVGNFKVGVRMKARYVDTAKCNGCGECWQKCPAWRVEKAKGDKKVVHKSLTLGPPKAIYMPTLQAVPNVPVIDKESCIYFKNGKCKICVKSCPKDAINHDMKDVVLDVEVGNIIVATGFQTFDAAKMPQYGYGRLKNVLTAIEFERLNCASGATGGAILCENGLPPKSIAILHCIGSRDKENHEYCSRVCCMYALKFAHLVKEKTGAEVYDLYIDMRAFGKGYEEFYNRLLEEGVRFIRGKAASVTDYAIYPEEEGKLVVRCEDTLVGRVRRIPVDMVILCTALEARAEAPELARLIKLCQGKEGWFTEKHPKLAPVSTASDGIFIAGCCQGPKDIPDTVAQASGAAAQVLTAIAKGKVQIEGVGAEIIEDKCTGCRICNDLCPYKAIDFIADKKKSKVNDALCKACGTCVAACPCSAIKAKHFTDTQIMREIEGVLYDATV
jgi:heterodisulfide reductase subunit A